jgi:hypothetical protein
MDTDVSEKPTALNFREREEYMEPAGSSKPLVPAHHTAGSYITKSNIKLLM